MSKYINLTGLTQYDGLIKNYINTADAKAFKSANFDEDTRVLSLYKAETTDGVADFTVEIPKSDISGLMAKLTGATTGNVVVANADGTVADGGVALANLATKAEIETVDDKADANADAIEAINNTETGILKASQDYTDEKVAELAGGAVATNTADITTMKGQIEALEAGTYDDSELRELIDDKADASTTIAGYGITDAYTKGEVDTAITTAVANAEHLKRSVVDSLPDVAEADAHTIYMVAVVGGDGNQKYEEFMLINDAFEKIGDSAVDLTDYATDSDVSTAKTEALDEAKAYADGLALNYDAAGSANASEVNSKAYADELNTAMSERVDAIEASIPEIEAITPAEIEALFNA